MNEQSFTVQNSNPTISRIKRAIAVRYLFAFIFFGLFFFLPAGTLLYWEAWIYIGILMIPMLLVMLYFLKHDPELLERRMRMKEKEREQKWIIGVGNIFYFIAFLLPGFDHRFGWSAVPPLLVVLADIIILLGYGIFARVLKENSYASRIIEVDEQQKVIETGPYGIVRHPMYSGILLMFCFSPLALGSYWALLPMVALPIVLVARIANEEMVLSRDLPGYTEYTKKVRYRLIPGLW